MMLAADAAECTQYRHRITTSDAYCRRFFLPRRLLPPVRCHTPRRDARPLTLPLDVTSIFDFRYFYALPLRVAAVYADAFCRYASLMRQRRLPLRHAARRHFVTLDKRRCHAAAIRFRCFSVIRLIRLPSKALRVDIVVTPLR